MGGGRGGCVVEARAGRGGQRRLGVLQASQHPAGAARAARARPRVITARNAAPSPVALPSHSHRGAQGLQGLALQQQLRTPRCCSAGLALCACSARTSTGVSRWKSPSAELSHHPLLGLLLLPLPLTLQTLQPPTPLQCCCCRGWVSHRWEWACCWAAVGEDAGRVGERRGSCSCCPTSHAQQTRQSAAACAAAAAGSGRRPRWHTRGAAASGGCTAAAGPAPTGRRRHGPAPAAEVCSTIHVPGQFC